MSKRFDSRAYLEAIDRFRSLLEDSHTKESHWQQLFSDCPYILSDALPLRVLPSQIRPLGRPGVREADFAVMPGPNNPTGLAALVEIKRPDARIFTSDRQDIIKLSAVASGAVSQIQVYGSQFAWPESVLGFGNNRYLFVIIGTLSTELDRIREEIIRMQLKHLLPNNVGLFAFDQVLSAFEAKAKQMGAFPSIIVLGGDNFPVPTWAEAAGCDEYGRWAEFRVQSAAQRMRWIPEGKFLMGSDESEADRDPDEGPQHEVTFSEGFWLADTVCTHDLWRTGVPWKGEGTFPVGIVTPQNAAAFLKGINSIKEGLDLRIPSEAEWEYACRAGTTTRYWFGNHESDLAEYAWYRDNALSRDVQQVAQKPPNPWGLFDMSGNVWELCADSWHSNYVGAPADGSVWRGSHQYYVQRGGCYVDTFDLCRSATRSWCVPAAGRVMYPNSGLRVARSAH